VRRVGFFGNLGDPREAGNVEAGWSGRWVAGCVLGYPGVVTWVNGECPRKGQAGVRKPEEGGGTFALKCGHR